MNGQLFSGDEMNRETYVLWEEDIQYWDIGLFMSSGTTGESRGSHIEFSFENRKVKN